MGTGERKRAASSTSTWFELNRYVFPSRTGCCCSNAPLRVCETSETGMAGSARSRPMVRRCSLESSEMRRSSSRAAFEWSATIILDNPSEFSIMQAARHKQHEMRTDLNAVCSYKGPWHTTTSTFPKYASVPICVNTIYGCIHWGCWSPQDSFDTPRWQLDVGSKLLPIIPQTRGDPPVDQALAPAVETIRLCRTC